MIFQGKKSYQFEIITIKGNNQGQGNPALEPGIIQAFEITHTTFTGTPTLVEQYDDVLNGIAPEDLLDGNSLKYINNIALSRDINNPNDTTSVAESQLLGNVGFYGENLNGGPTNYSVQNVVFKRLDNTDTGKLELTPDETICTGSIINTIDAPFVDLATKAIVGIHYAPADQSLYRDNTLATSQTMNHNFIIDQIVETVGNPGLEDAMNLGTPLQTILSCEFTFVSASQIDFEIHFQLSGDVVSRISANNEKRYVLYIETANHLLARGVSDKVNLIIDVNDYFLDLSDDGLITMDQRFMEHPFSDMATQSVEFVRVKPVDDLLCFNTILLDKAGRETDDINFTEIRGEMIVRKTSGASFIVDSEVFPLGIPKLVDYPPYGNVPELTVEKTRGYATPADSNREFTKFYRDYSADSGSLFGYIFSITELIRWETFIAAANVDSEFFEPTEDNDGENQDWFHYSNKADWDLYTRTTLTLTKNGNSLAYFKEQKIEMRDYLADPDWIDETLQSFDEDLVEQIDGPTLFIDGSINNVIWFEATFAGISPPSLADVAIVLKVDETDIGTFKNTYWLSSEYDQHPNTKWTGVGGTIRVTVTGLGGGRFRGEAILIGPLLNQANKYDITGRLYDKRGEAPPPPPAVPKLMEDGTPKRKEGSTTFKIKEL